MINKLYYFQKTTMSLPEFLALERGEITLKEIKANRQLDNFIGKIMANKQLKKAFVFLTALGLTFQTFTFTALGAVDTSKIDYAGSTILLLLRTAGYWVCIIIASKDILTSLLSGDTKAVGKSVMKSLAAFGGFYILPWLFDLIKDILV